MNMNSNQTELRSYDELKLLQAQLERVAAWNFWRASLIFLSGLLFIISMKCWENYLASDHYVWWILGLILLLLLFFVPRYYFAKQFKGVSLDGLVCINCNKSNCDRFRNLWLTGKCYFCKQQLFDLSTREVEMNDSAFNYTYADFKAMSVEYQKQINKMSWPWFVYLCVMTVILIALYQYEYFIAFVMAIVIGMIIFALLFIPSYIKSIRLMKEYPAVRCPCCYEPIRHSKLVEESGCCDECGRKIFRTEPKNGA